MDNDVDNDVDMATLVERLAALEAEVEMLRAERNGGARRAGAADAVIDAPPASLSRRAVLGRIGGLAAAGVGAVAASTVFASPVAASTGDPVIIGVENGPASRNPDQTTLLGETASNTDAVFRVENSGAGDAIVGVSASGWGVMGSSSSLAAGVSGTGPSIGVEGVGNTGVRAFATDGGVGVRATSIGGTAVLGEGDTGVQGSGNVGPGVAAFSTLGHGVTAFCDRVNKAALFANPNGDANGLWAITNSTAVAVRVDTFGSGGGQSIVTNSISSMATGFEVSVAGKGIGADVSAASGIGIKAKGKRAPLLLVPATTAGRPTSGNHQRGEFFVDNAGTLFVCTAPGTPGTWVKVTTTPA